MTGFTFGGGGEGFKLDSDSWDIGIDSSFDTPRTGLTVPTDAIQSMAPVDSGSSFGEWGGFFQDLLKTSVGYAIAKDAARSGVVAPGAQGAAQGYPLQQRPAAQVVGSPMAGMTSMMVPLLLVGLGAVVVVKLLK